MTTTELQAQLDQARSTVHKLQKAVAIPSGDVEADLATETQLAGAERLVERLERQLSTQQEAEEAEREKQVREDAQARQHEVRTEFYAKAGEMGTVLNAAARELEPVLSAVGATLAELRRLSNEHDALHMKLHGERPDDLERLFYPGSLPPVFDFGVDDRSPLFGAIERAFFAHLRPDAALHNLHYMQSIDAKRSLFKPTPTPQVIENDSLFARSRRGPLNDE